jgi:hypothetical protein
VPRICAFQGIAIFMFFKDHGPPHFHARYGEYKMKMAIDTLAVVDGSLPPRQIRLVREWAMQHRADLMENWLRASVEVPLKAIEPLP